MIFAGVLAGAQAYWCRVTRRDPVAGDGGESQYRTAVPFQPFRSRAAHVVQLRPITVHQAADD
jgi:hypothetical protein